MNAFEKIEAIAICREKLARDGLSVRQLDTDVEIGIALTQVQKPYLTPLLDPAKNDFTNRNSFWLALEHDGVVVAVGAARLDDLGSHGNIEEFWRSSLSRHYDFDPTEIFEWVSPKAKSILRGKLVYFGDLRLAKGAGRRRDTLRRFTFIGQMYACLLWRPDAIYAFLTKKDLGRGAQYYYSFRGLIEPARMWSKAVDPWPGDEACGYNMNEDLADIAHNACKWPDRV